ncbi:hypothetical protein [Lysobacter sp. TAB13]|uniref:hypothetical protein n=1 Tax=Lysobacter sp. TAB13 TaxID=3233065 RepID=UPI003F9A853F
MTDVSLPPVPQKLRETLKDYPEHIERLQAALNSAAENPSKATLPFEFAIWMLKGTLGEFVDEARDEVQAAQARNDSIATEKAKTKKFIFGAARADMGVLSELEAYFDARHPQ